MISQVTATPGGQTVLLLPAQPAVTGTDGTVWRPATPKRLTEKAAERIVWRPSARVAVERARPETVDRIARSAARKEHWDRHIKGHVEDGTGQCTPMSRA